MRNNDSIVFGVLLLSDDLGWRWIAGHRFARWSPLTSADGRNGGRDRFDWG